MRNPYKQFSNISPQRESGDRRIANDLFEALVRAGLSGSEYQVALLVIGQTWGFCKLSDGISFSQINKAIKLSRRTAINAVAKLEKKRIFVVDRMKPNNKRPYNEYLFNKYYDTWVNKTGERIFTNKEVEQIRQKYGLVKKSSPLIGEGKFTRVVKKSSPLIVKESSPTKEIKDTSTKISTSTYKKNEKEKKIDYSKEDMEFVISLESLILKNKPDYIFAGQRNGAKRRESWANDFRLTREKDKRPPSLIKEILIWSQNNSFWKKNIKSAAKLREHFDRLQEEFQEKGENDGPTKKSGRNYRKNTESKKYKGGYE